MSKHFQENKKDLAYYLTLYKLAGHTTWRAHLSTSKDGFEREKKAWSLNSTMPKITETQCLRLDRVTGTFTA